MKKAQLVVGESYAVKGRLAVYLGEVNVYRRGGYRIPTFVGPNDYGKLEPAFAIKPWYPSEGWQPIVLGDAMQTVEMTWAQHLAIVEREQHEREARALRQREREQRHTQQAKTLAHLLGPGVSVEVDQYGYAKIDAAQLIEKLCVKVPA